MHKHAERHTALIANPRTPWRETDRKHLETIDDDRLKELEQDAKAREEEAAKVKAADEKAAADKKAADDAAAATTTTPAAPAQAAAPKAAAAAAATPASVGDADVDAYLADPNTPQFAKDLCLAQLQGQTERRNELLTTLKGNDNIARAWKPEELDAIANTMLEKLAASLPTQATQVGRVVDFSARGARPTGLGGTDATKVPAPPSLTAHVQQLAAKKAAGQ